MRTARFQRQRYFVSSATARSSRFAVQRKISTLRVVFSPKPCLWAGHKPFQPLETDSPLPLKQKIWWQQQTI